MAIAVSALIAAGATAAGDYMSAQGQQETNTSNAALAVSQDQFSNYQLAENQNFNSAQALANRTFQNNMMTRTMDYNTMMADTAEQRRVADLKAAGLNPLLAASAGAATAPQMNPTSGATASSSGGGVPGAPTMQNPSAAYGNLGQGIQSAMQLNQQQAQIDLAKAQAAKIESDTPSGKGTDPDGIPYVGDKHQLGDATLAQIKSQTGVLDATAQQVKANTDYIALQMKNTDAQTALTNINAMLQGQNLQVLQATKQYVIQQQAASGAAAENLGNVERGPWGGVLAILNAVLKPVTSAMGAAGAISR